MRMYIQTKNGKSDELHISHGYQNSKGEIYLSEDEACEENKISEIICEKISSKCSEIDPNKDVYMEFIKIKNNEFKKNNISIKGSLYKTIKLNDRGTTFDIDIDDGSKVNTETWTILSIEEIREKIDKNQEYYEE